MKAINCHLSMRTNRSSRSLGQQGEEIAAKFLTKNGYQVVTRNYRWARGEIDIVARKRNMLVFVEVKTARARTFGAPETWVDERKQQQIGQVALRYLQEKEIDEMDCRFDVVAVTFYDNQWRVRHIENAFWL